MLLLLLSAGCGDKAGGSPGASPSGIARGPKAIGSTTTTVAQKMTQQLPDGTLFISVFVGSATPAPAGAVQGPLYTSDQGWYLFLVRLVSQRTSSPPAGARQLFATPDLPSLPLADQKETVLRVDLKANGRSQAHRSGGVEVVVAIQGKIEVRSGTFPPTQLAAGEGVYVLDNTPLQVWSLGGQPASYLDYYLLPSVRALATDCDCSP